MGLVLGLIVAVSTPSSASECTKLIQQVNDEAGNRLDDAGYNARLGLTIPPSLLLRADQVIE